MALVDINGIQVTENPAKFNTPFSFLISFECATELKEDLEFKLTYVGSAESDKYDQVLDTLCVGPVPQGASQFMWTADPPNANLIPPQDLIGVTVILLTCSYKQQEFIRVGYYVNNNYSDPLLRDVPPPRPDISLLERNILADQPRVTKIAIQWD